LTSLNADDKENLHIPIKTLQDNNELLHHQVCYAVPQSLSLVAREGGLL
jgi:hypothetical protein